MSKTKQVLYSSSNYITTQDVPDELALAISLSGCPIHCKGCHSAMICLEISLLKINMPPVCCFMVVNGNLKDYLN